MQVLSMGGICKIRVHISGGAYAVVDLDAVDETDRKDGLCVTERTRILLTFRSGSRRIFPCRNSHWDNRYTGHPVFSPCTDTCRTG